MATRPSQPEILAKSALDALKSPKNLILITFPKTPVAWWLAVFNNFGAIRISDRGKP